MIFERWPTQPGPTHPPPAERPIQEGKLIMTASFPVAIYGTEAQVEKRLVAASRAWADDLRKGASLRALESREVPPGTRIFCSGIPAINPGQPEWRAYELVVVRAEVAGAIDWEDDDRIHALLEAEFLRLPAGVLWLNVGWPAPNTLAILRPRIAALLGCWGQLSTLSYLDTQLQPQTLEAVIEDHYKPFFEIWLDAPTEGPLAGRLQAAIDVALASSDADARERMISACRQLARRWDRITSPERFDDRGWIERQLAAVRPTDYESAKTGKWLNAMVFAMHRKSEREGER
jgi:hypothetical protein